MDKQASLGGPYRQTRQNYDQGCDNGQGHPTETHDDVEWAVLGGVGEPLWKRTVEV